MFNTNLIFFYLKTPYLNETGLFPSDLVFHEGNSVVSLFYPHPYEYILYS